MTFAFDTLDRLTSAGGNSYTYGDSAHLHAATAIGTSNWTASYDAAGDMTCRAPSSAATCAGTTPTGAQLSYDNEGRLSAWQNAPGSSPTSSDQFLYDGAGQRVEQQTTSSGATTTTVYVGQLEELSTMHQLTQFIGVLTNVITVCYAVGGPIIGYISYRRMRTRNRNAKQIGIAYGIMCECIAAFGLSIWIATESHVEILKTICNFAGLPIMVCFGIVVSRIEKLMSQGAIANG